MLFPARRAAAIGMALMAVLTQACDRTPEPKGSAEKATGGIAPVASPSASSVTTEATSQGRSFRFPAKQRLVAIGDLHGDLQALRRALRLAQAIDGQDRWVGQELTLVQTGDQIDRGDQDREVLDLLASLERQAEAAGSALHVLNGNHELMNVALDFRYVTPLSLASFKEFAGAKATGAALADMPPEALGRVAAFAPGGPYARQLARRATVAVIGDTLFAHGGVLPEHVEYGLGRINAEVSGFLDGNGTPMPQIVQQEDGPVWTRIYGTPELTPRICQALGQVLAKVGAQRMVVGHTVQKAGITSACEERVFRIDVGLAAYYGQTSAQVLEITAAGTRVLRGNASSKTRVNADLERRTTSP